MTVTWCLLTFNRREIVKESVLKNFNSKGDSIDEIVWCDNNSTDGTREWVQKILRPDVSILNEVNVGADAGYNRCLQLARSDWVVITGCDMVMPKNWLKTFKDCAVTVTNTGIICMYAELASFPDRIYGEREQVGDFVIQKAFPTERRFFKRSLLQEIGYHREDLGLYGWADAIWAETAKKKCDELELRYYVLPDEQVTQIQEHDEYYRNWKHSMAWSDQVIQKRDQIIQQGCPPYFP